MQVANALNNQIRILFNPSVEDFRLFDFLIVKSNMDKYLAQIIEIYDDKFDASQNVAKLKLFYKISIDNEVIPYDNFTPNKECEIIKIKQNEVEDFINADKATFILGMNAKSPSPIKVQYDFFENNPIILADKIDDANKINLNLAKNLSTAKNVVIIDSTGILEYKDAHKIKACSNFRMPLDYTTIDYVFDKCLEDASLEFQSIAAPIINEIKKFSRNQKNEFIPFNVFIRVLMEQYKATPYPELKILVAKMKKIQMNELFARGKKDKENLIETIKKNKITILDLSSVKTTWQKAFLDYITDAINEEVFLITRLNDENCDVDIVNKIYKKSNLSFIPNVSYNYKKLPTIIQHCKNYVLLPSLYQRSDFLDANFALNNLISDCCVIFGENTDNFVYLVRDYELDIKQNSKIYRKIALSLLDNEEKMRNNLGAQGDYFENIKKQEAQSDSEKLLKELSELNQEQEKEIQQKEEIKQEQETNNEQEEQEETQQDNKKDEFQPIDEVESEQVELNTTNTTDEFQKIDNYKNQQEEIKEDLEKIKQEKEENEKANLAFERELQEIEEEVENNSNNNEIIVEDTSLEAQEIDEIQKDEEIEKTPEIEENSQDEIQEVSEEIIEKPASIIEIEKEEETKQEDEFEPDENQKNVSSDVQVELETIEFSENEIQSASSNKENTVEDLDFVDSENIEIKPPKMNVILDISSDDEISLQQEVEENQETKEVENIDLSDDDLDFFAIAKESSKLSQEENQDEFETSEVQEEKIIVDNVEYNTSNNETDNIKKDELSNATLEEDIKQEMEDDLDLDFVAQNSLDTSFDDIINTKQEIQEPTINIEEDVNINLLEKQEPKENLPIFKEESPLEEKQETHVYQKGEIIEHSKYGRGTIIKIVKYEDRQLLQIEFEEHGKKLLDPKIANIKIIN